MINLQNKKNLKISDLNNYDKIKNQGSAIESDKALKDFIAGDGRENARSDFKELIKRASQPVRP